MDLGRPEPAETISGLYAEHALGLTRLALVMIGDRESAEDVVQEAFLGLHRRFDRLRDPDRALVYLRSSVLNNARSVLRRRRLPSWFAGTYAPPVWSAESEVMLGAERRAVMEALQRLPRRRREVLLLRFYAELSEEETAQAMGVSRGTVKSTTHRALDALGRLLGENQ
ncbi:MULTISPECIES: SigE family RNA polymerase sigma factor [Streptosporangium]|uniref:RNA polymerase sigma-70 factor (Sigma-E family) n=1 Tax=Streptosporangium brasiliense TaxID=47480 RepID=A0ABT9R4Z7_9ACTN|nr:SigE family RNA polymerase sigma factor [Streptosporangium brasiliense]MDP9863884.1 RNA polymerase sigma-70 factor (sigma-E family) [Streptosporangium brasiliense]